MQGAKPVYFLSLATIVGVLFFTAQSAAAQSNENNLLPPLNHFGQNTDDTASSPVCAGVDPAVISDADAAVQAAQEALNEAQTTLNELLATAAESAANLPDVIRELDGQIQDLENQLETCGGTGNCQEILDAIFEKNQSIDFFQQASANRQTDINHLQTVVIPPLAEALQTAIDHLNELLTVAGCPPDYNSSSNSVNIGHCSVGDGQIWLADVTEEECSAIGGDWAPNTTTYGIESVDLGLASPAQVGSFAALAPGSSDEFGGNEE